MHSTIDISHSKPTELLTRSANAAIFYHPEGFDTSQAKLMGRQAAGESFLKAWAQYADVERYYCYAGKKSFAEDFHKKVQVAGQKQKPTHWITANQIEKLSEPGCLFLPGPGLGEYAWQRRYSNPKNHSLCGITHTTASARVMDIVGDLLIAPVQPWDALICTSHSVKKMVLNILDRHHDYLSQRLGTDILPNLIQLPVIPLGVDAEAFQPTPEKQRIGQALREKIGIQPDETVILFVGRLSFHAKAHPYPLFLALENAAKQTQKPIRLILSGWTANDAIKQQFIEGARIACPSVLVTLVDGRQPTIRENIWYASDIFISLSDNIQETFGITPIEAKAAGLPVIVSDWDGYQETVTQEIDGFKIPTVLPPGSSGEDLAYRHMSAIDTYDLYIGQTALSTAVDISVCTAALVTLINSPELRKEMGDAGIADVKARFDWRIIIPQYQMLWSELKHLRHHTETVAPNRSGDPINPLRQDPFTLFSHYATTTLTPDTLLKVNQGLDSIELQTSIKNLYHLSMNTFGEPVRYPRYQIEAMLMELRSCQPITIQVLRQTYFSNQSPQWVYRTISWLLKMDLLHLG